MNREEVIRAADALGRLDSLKSARKRTQDAPHDAMPIVFFPTITAYYPREQYMDVLETLIADEEQALADLGVEL